MFIYRCGMKIALRLGIHYKKGINMLKPNVLRFLPGGRRHLGRGSACQPLPRTTRRSLPPWLPTTKPRTPHWGDRVETLLRTDIGLAGSRIRRVLEGSRDYSGRHRAGTNMRCAGPSTWPSGVRGVREVRNAMKEVDVPK